MQFLDRKPRSMNKDCRPSTHSQLIKHLIPLRYLMLSFTISQGYTPIDLANHFNSIQKITTNDIDWRLTSKKNIYDRCVCVYIYIMLFRDDIYIVHIIMAVQKKHDAIL